MSAVNDVLAPRVVDNIAMSDTNGYSFERAVT